MGDHPPPLAVARSCSRHGIGGNRCQRLSSTGAIAEDDFGLKPKLTYARGSVEWEAGSARMTRI